MSAAAVATLVITGLIVAALAVTLIWVVVILVRINRTLGLVTFGVRAIAHRTVALNETMAAINASLGAVADGLDGLVEQTQVSRTAG
jgi:hypothetical protein